MAGLAGSNVDFSWLGNLPDVYREAQDRRSTKETLSNLKSGSADDLIEGGARLLRAGNVAEGLKIIGEGRQRKAIEQRGEELRLYLNQPKTDFSGLLGGQPGGPPGPVTFPGAGAAEPPAAAPGSNLFNGPPGAIPGVGPRSEAPATQQTAFNTTPWFPGSPQYPKPYGDNPPIPPPAAPRASPSPSDAIIAAAQQGAAPEGQPPQQLAGPPPTPNTLPGQTPVMSAETLNAAAAPAVPAAPAPTAPGGVKLEPPSAQGVRPNQTPPEVLRNIANIAQAMSAPSTKYSAGERKALADLMKREIDKTHWDEKTKSFMVDQADRRAAGETVQSRSEWDADIATRETTFKSASKKYETYAEDLSKGQALNTVLGSMESIVNHPQFAAGAGSPIFAQGVSALTALRDTAKALGVQQSTIDKIVPKNVDDIVTTTALQEAFTALSNQAIYAKLGSLGNQISEGDRNFIKLAFPSLSLTKEGNLFLIGIMRKMADNAEKSGMVAQAYMERAGSKARPEVMDRLVREASKDNSLFVKDGKVTDAGEAVKEAVKQARGGTLKAPEPPPQAPRAGGAQGGTPLNGPKTKENPEGLYIRLPDGQIVPEGQL